ncbi:hypothetical protein ADUPG1_012750 [Aduncisulcus paluster]|uniref:DBF4-type domain-containing protein n=1 Tax=Aduncisulcus paluster TaxID=2918883 RepID=A0ABQ5K0J3_9EUKA|nr:hypothetical protein ADUPG1_012750 [Aduncisulcus paluster]
MFEPANIQELRRDYAVYIMPKADKETKLLRLAEKLRTKRINVITCIEQQKYLHRTPDQRRQYVYCVCADPENPPESHKLPPEFTCKYMTRKDVVRAVNLVLTKTRERMRRIGHYMPYDSSSQTNTVIHIQDTEHKYAPLSFTSEFPVLARPQRGYRPLLLHTRYPGYYALEQRLPFSCDSPLLPWYYVDDCRLAYTTDLTLTRVPRRIINGDTLTPALFLSSYQCAVEAYRLALQETQRILRCGVDGREAEAARHLASLYRTYLNQYSRTTSGRRVAASILIQRAKQSMCGSSNADKYSKVPIEEDNTKGYCSVCGEEYHNYTRHIKTEQHRHDYFVALTSEELLPCLKRLSQEIKLKNKSLTVKETVPYPKKEPFPEFFKWSSRAMKRTMEMDEPGFKGGR